tara:strand:+ start:680 stop:922 length:243 start_codon:yes stop_codon:yes gene_type:complete
MDEQLTKGERFICDWQYGHLGGFSSSLIDAIRRADENNRERLRRGFPDEVLAYEQFSHTSGWWYLLQAKAKRLGFNFSCG